MFANSIREASSPFRIIGGFLGTYLLDYERFYLNRLYMIIIWIFYLCATFRLQLYLLEQGIFSSIVSTSVVNANGIIALATAFFNATYKQTSEKCFESLCNVDDTLRSLGVSLEYRTVYRESIITLTLLVVAYGGVSVIALIGSQCFYTLPQAMCIAMIISYPLLLTYISDFNYWIVLRSIEDRFDRLNQYVDDLSNEKENHVRTFSKNTCFVSKSRRNDDSRNNHCNVWIIMKLHLQLNKTSRAINRMFSVDFGLQMGVYFFNTIEVISFVYLVYFRSSKISTTKLFFILAHVFFNLLHFTKIVLTNCACENVQRKSKAMEAVLTNYINTVHDPESWQHTHQFLMQVKQRPLQFTALGFINLGFTCLVSMFTSMTETVIIMIQLGGMAHANYLRPGHNVTINQTKW